MERSIPDFSMSSALALYLTDRTLTFRWRPASLLSITHFNRHVWEEREWSESQKIALRGHESNL